MSKNRVLCGYFLSASENEEFVKQTGSCVNKPTLKSWRLFEMTPGNIGFVQNLRHCRSYSRDTEYRCLAKCFPVIPIQASF